MYIIDHYYQINHHRDCLVLGMSMDTDMVVKICCAIEFYYEQLYGDDADISLNVLNKCLVNIYGATDLRNIIDVSSVELPINKSTEETVIATEHGNIFATIIDVHHAREENVDNVNEILKVVVDMNETSEAENFKLKDRYKELRSMFDKINND